MPKKACHGIILFEGNSFLCVKVSRLDGAWRVASVRHWDSSSFVHNTLLFNKRIIAGVTSHWKKAGNSNDVFDESLIHAKPTTLLSAHTHDALVHPFIENLASNLCGVTADDAFLCTVPFAFCNPKSTSFVSVYKADTCFKIGVTLESELNCVFSMTPSTPDALEFHLAKIERYLQTQNKPIAMPRQIYLLGSNLKTLPETPAQLLDLSPYGLDNYDTLKATGVALCGITGKVGLIKPATLQSANIKTRSLVYLIASILLLLSLLISIAIPVSDFIMKQQLLSYKAHYRQILSHNADVKDMTKKNDSLAQSILMANDIARKQTHWTDFLTTIANSRPQGLYFDKIGTDPQKRVGLIKVALAGWAANESQVTDFISVLQKNSQISNISLSSIEREESHSTVQFRIECFVKLSESSQTR